MFFKNRN